MWYVPQYVYKNISKLIFMQIKLSESIIILENMQVIMNSILLLYNLTFLSVLADGKNTEFIKKCKFLYSFLFSM